MIELKSHPYFDGIDWDKIAQRNSEPPFEPTEMETKINYDDILVPLDLDTLMRDKKEFATENDSDVDGDLIENSFVNYSFVGPEHQI